jgi:hypothetical protein
MVCGVPILEVNLASPVLLLLILAPAPEQPNKFNEKTPRTLKIPENLRLKCKPSMQIGGQGRFFSS